MNAHDERPFCPVCHFQMKVGRMSRCPQCGARLRESGETEVAPNSLSRAPTAVQPRPTLPKAGEMPGDRPPPADPELIGRRNWRLVGGGIGAWLGALGGAAAAAASETGETIDVTIVSAVLGGIVGPLVGALLGSLGQMRSLFGGGDEGYLRFGLGLGAVTGAVLGPGFWSAFAAQRPEAAVSEWLIIGGAVAAALLGAGVGVGLGVLAWRWAGTD